MHKLNILILILCVIFFMTAIHGIDNAYNILIVKQITGIQFYDSNFFGTTINPYDLYNQSVITAMSSFIIAIIVLLFSKNEK